MLSESYDDNRSIDEWQAVSRIILHFQLAVRKMSNIIYLQFSLCLSHSTGSQCWNQLKKHVRKKVQDQDFRKISEWDHRVWNLMDPIKKKLIKKDV